MKNTNFKNCTYFMLLSGIPHFCLERFSFINIIIFQKFIFKFNASLLKTLAGFYLGRLMGSDQVISIFLYVLSKAFPWGAANFIVT